jgi:hypothetical protein
MTRDEMLDQAVGKCLAVRTGSWGTCRTHGVGWAPAAFHDRRCWRTEETIKGIDLTLAALRSEVDVLMGQRYDQETPDFNSGWDSALIAVLALFDGKSNG